MKSNYSNKVLKFINEKYKDIVCVDDFISISVGGSVARGHAVEESDIDLICISKKVLQYKKIFKKINNMRFEIHVIPIDYINILLPKISNYILFINNISDTTTDVVSMGAKKCNIITKMDDEFTRLLSAWRELKKIVDSIILYEDNSKYLTKLKKQFEEIKISRNIFLLFEKNMDNYSNIDLFINLLKLYSLLQHNVFSKVLWTDIYIEKEYNKQIKRMIDEIFNNIYIDTERFLLWKDINFNYLLDVHSNINCDFCKEDYLQCNIMRCIIDYINDIERARKYNMKYGEILSIKKCSEYIEALLKKVNVEDNELTNIIKKFEIDREKTLKIYCFIKKENCKN